MNQEIEDIMARLEEMRTICAKEGREPNTSEINESAELIKRMQALESGEVARQWAESLPQHPPIKPNPQDTGGHYRPGSNLRTGGLRGPKDAKNFAALFGKTLDRDGWKDSNEFFRAALSGRYHPNLRAAITEGGPPSEGGFLVPEEYAREIFDVALEDEIVFPRCRVQPMASDTIKVPAFEIGSHAAHLYGGLVAYWRAEATNLTESAPKVRQMELNAQKLTVFMRYSSEWQEDAPGGETAIARIAGKGLGWYRDLAHLKGTGAGEPLGVLNSPCLITASAEPGQLPDTLQYENLVNMLARLHPACWNNSVWVIHPTVIPQLLTMGITVGVGGTHYPVLKEDSGQFSMLGRPCIFSEKMEPVGDKGDILLADFSQYICGVRREISFATSPHLYFQSDEWAARLIARLDGQSLWNTALTMPDGVSTLSPFITLEAR